MTPPLATVGIASIGEMGLGIARLLSAHGYKVLTSVSGRRSAQFVARRVLSALLMHLQRVNPTARQVRLDWHSRRASGSGCASRLHPLNSSASGRGQHSQQVH